jgi:tetratricopeptide (TPR) repeat protein
MCSCLPLAACAALAGCAGVALPPPPAELLATDRFAAVAVDTDPAQALALNPAMQQFLAHELRPLARLHGPRQALVVGLQRLPQLRLEYDASVTRTAAQAFEARAGNCLSLTLMTGALAAALGLNVVYQQVDGGPAWSRSGDLLAYSGHVNVMIDHGHLGGAGARWQQRLVVDFLPPADAAAHPASPIDEATVLGMFLNNRAAEALAAGRVDEAHAWVRSALRTAPRFVPAWNTLAVLLQARGQDALAQRVLQHAVAAEPDNTRALANLVGVLEAAGRHDEAASWRSRLRRLEPVAPFVWFDRGRAAMARGELGLAYEAFARELARDPDQHEAHAGAASAAIRLGDLAAARRHLERARAAGPTPAAQALYAAKLARLGQTQQH